MQRPQGRGCSSRETAGGLGLGPGVSAYPWSMVRHGGHQAPRQSTHSTKPCSRCAPRKNLATSAGDLDDGICSAFCSGAPSRPSSSEQPPTRTAPANALPPPPPPPSDLTGQRDQPGHAA